jgi:3-dehydroquinate dehydratase-2
MVIMDKKKVYIINGPNLDLVGKREPSIYGHRAMSEIIMDVVSEYIDSLDIVYRSSNHEGDIIDMLHAADEDSNALGVVLNAGAYTHTSLAIADAIRAISLPVVEVHLSNISAREPIRRTSLISDACRGSIAGFGGAVYSLGVRALTML